MQYQHKVPPFKHQIIVFERTVYGVIDPRNDQLRYVGITHRPLAARLASHLRAKDKTHRGNWFRNLSTIGVSPAIFQIETVPAHADWRDAECFWISYFRSLGARLVNTSSGGDGAFGVKDSEETRLKKSLGMRGKKKSEIHKQKLAAALRGKAPPNKGIPCREETKKKLSARLKGVKLGPWTEEQRAKHRLIMKGKNAGKPWSEKRRAAYEERWSA